MKITKTRLKQIIQEVLEEDFGSPGQPGWETEASTIEQYPETPDLEEGVRELLDQWPDKRHPYYQDLENLYTQFTTG